MTVGDYDNDDGDNDDDNDDDDDDNDDEDDDGNDFIVTETEECFYLALFPTSGK